MLPKECYDEENEASFGWYRYVNIYSNSVLKKSLFQKCSWQLENPELQPHFIKCLIGNLNVYLIKVRRQSVNNCIQMVLQTCQDGFVRCSIYRSTLEKHYWLVVSARDTGSHHHSVTRLEKENRTKVSLCYGFTLVTRDICNPKNMASTYFHSSLIFLCEEVD